MTEVLEPASMAAMLQDFDEKCPFNEDVKGAKKAAKEHIKNDDTKRALVQQANNGGELGKNLTSGSQGKAGTVGGPPDYDAPKAGEDPAYDSKRKQNDKFLYAFVPEAGDVPEGPFPLLVAAHHLIPGNASLKRAKVMDYMTKNKTVQSVKKKKYKIKDHIGYNVNGAHNGVWLPGSYAIRRTGAAWQRLPKKGKSWSGMGDHPWRITYVAAVVKAAGGQFHDAHTKYSDAVKLKLNDIATALAHHLDNCTQCQGKDKLPPPFKIKLRLYNLSGYLKGKLVGGPSEWKRPYFASDPWRDKAFSAPGQSVSQKFMTAYNAARALHLDKHPPKK